MLHLFIIINDFKKPSRPILKRDAFNFLRILFCQLRFFTSTYLTPLPWIFIQSYRYLRKLMWFSLWWKVKGVKY